MALRFWLKRLAIRQQANTLDSIRLSGRQVEKVLFLCFGNICRSPFAERYAAKLIPGIEILSAGFYAQEKRSSPEDLQLAARRLGVNLADWASKRVTQDMVNKADLIVLMDLRNYRDFRHTFPQNQVKVVFLGLFLDPPKVEISDPYGKASDEMTRILMQIEEGISALAKCLLLGSH